MKKTFTIAPTRVSKLITVVFLLLVTFSGIAQTGRSLDFDATHSNRIILPFGLTGSYTKEAWIRPSAAALTAFPNIISGINTALYLANGKLTAGHDASTFIDVQDNVAMVANTWYHVAVTYDANTGQMKLYKDGALVGSSATAPTYTEPFQYISFFSGNNYFTGQIDEVRIWNYARTGAQINASRNCELTGDEPNLIAYYNFNQGTAAGNNSSINRLQDMQDKCIPSNGIMENFLLSGTTSNWVAASPSFSGTCNNLFANIAVTGNGNCIPNADITPVTTDFTNLGSFLFVPVSKTFVIRNTGNALLNISGAVISGVNQADFTITSPPGSTVAAGASTSITITFNPTGTAGNRFATVTINNDDGDESSYRFDISGTKSQQGSALAFDGVDDKISLPLVFSGSYTKEAWIKTFKTTDFPNIISGTGTAFFLNNGRLAAGHASGGFGQIIDGTTLQTNLWYHVAVTYDSSTAVMKLYRNGALVATSNNVPGYTETEQNIGSFFGSNFFWGRINHVRIWKLARTDAEIAANYQCKPSGDEPGLLAVYNFSVGVSGGNNPGITSLPDESDKCTAYNGTLQNFALTGTVSNWVADSINLTSNCSATFPNIKLSGNNNCISSGEQNTSATNFTDFGIQNSTGADRIFSLQNTGSSVLTISNISFIGPDNSMFTLVSAPAASLAPGASTNFTVHFAPIGLGIKTAKIFISNNDPDEGIFNYSLKGTGSDAPFNITNITATSHADGTCNILWTTDVASNSRVEYGEQPGTLSSNVSNGTLVTSHNVLLSGLTQGITYYFRVISTDAASVSVTMPAPESAPLSFHMTPAIISDPFDQAVCAGSEVAFFSDASSDVAYGIQWQISTDHGLSWHDTTGATDQIIYFVTSPSDSGKQFRAVWTNAGGASISEAAELTVHTMTTGITDAVVCSNALPYHWNNQDYTTAGTYTEYLVSGNANGCDSTDILHLSIVDTSRIVTTLTLCSNMLPYHWQGNDYTTTGTYSIVLPAANANSCDTTATLNLTVTNALSSTTNVTLCRNLLPYHWNGTDYTASGTYMASFPASGGNSCDSVATLNLTIKDTSFSVTNVSVCRNLLPYIWNGNNYTASGTYRIVLPGANVNSCDSTATLNLIVKDTSFSVTNVSVCRNLLPYVWNGNNYTASGTYRIVLPGANVNSCDSTATLNLTVKDTSFSVTNVSVCRNLLPYVWNGNNYTASGTYRIILPSANINGCDSTATLNLTVKDTSFSVTSVSVCRNLLPYIWNGNNYTASGTYRIVLPGANVNSCDSTATLNLIVKDTSFSVTNVAVCRNLLPYVWNGNNYTASGTYRITLPGANVNSCDSTATLNFIVKDTSFSVTSVSVCRNLLPYVWNGNNYTASGTYRIILPSANINGCDSTATLNLAVKDTSFSITNVSVCRNLLPYVWNGNNYTASGTYRIVLPGANVNSCDSTATLNLTIKDTSFSVTNVSVCRNLLPYVWNGNNYTASGTYRIILPSANINGCDSTATLNLTVKDTSFSVTNVSVCRNLLPYVWNGNNYTASGTYRIVLPGTNVNSCDSTATLNLTVKDTSFSVTNVSVCRNLLPYVWNGNNYTASGTYRIVLPGANVNSCDSTATLNLIVKDTSFSVTNVSVCRNLLPYVWNGNNYTASGTYRIVLPGANMNSCDSTATLNLIVKDTSFSVANVSVCRNLLPYVWNGNNYTASGTYRIVLPGANVNSCDSTATLNLTVKDTSFSVTNVSVCRNLLPYVWNGNNYTASGTYRIILPSANINGCDSTATLNLTVKDTSFSVTNVSVCRNLLPYVWNGNNYTASGTYRIVLSGANMNSCDSTATLNLIVKDTSFSVTNVSVCRNLLPYVWNGNNYTASGTYRIILPSANINGCDSTATLNLTVKDTSFSVTNVSVCRNLLPYVWNGNNYTTSGTYKIVLPGANVNSCDSTATLNLIVKRHFIQCYQCFCLQKPVALCLEWKQLYSKRNLQNCSSGS